MNRSKRLEPVQHLADDQERRLAQSLAGYERRVREAETKLEELQRYQREYANQFSERAETGLGVMQLRDYRAFLARLSEAVRQQTEIVARARAERDQERQRWQSAAIRSKALGHVREQWDEEERRLLAKREQRENDERAQRKVGHP